MASTDVFSQAFTISKQIINALSIPNFAVYSVGEGEIYPCAVITQPEDIDIDYYSGINEFALSWKIQVKTKDLDSVVDGFYKQTANKGASKLAFEFRDAILLNRGLFTGIQNLIDGKITPLPIDGEVQGWEINFTGLYNITGGNC